MSDVIEERDAEAYAPGPGHNQPPLPTPDAAEPFKPKVSEFADVAREWAALKAITDEGQSEKLVDFLTGLRGLRKKVEDARKEAKKPWDDGAKAIQEEFKPLVDTLDKASKHLAAMQADFLSRQQAEIEKQKAEEAARAEEAQRRAEEAAREAESSLDAEKAAEADRKAKEAAAAQKAAAKPARASAKSASGAGRTMSTRTTWEAEITNRRAAFMEFQDDPEIDETLRRLAARRARSADFDPKTDRIPGVTLHPRQTAA